MDGKIENEQSIILEQRGNGIKNDKSSFEGSFQGQPGRRKKIKIKSKNTLTDILAEYKEENIKEISRIIKVIEYYGLKIHSKQDIVRFKSEHSLKLKEEEILKFLMGICDSTENENEFQLTLNLELLHRAKLRINQQIEIKQASMQSTTCEREEDLIESLLEIETNTEEIFILKQIGKDITKFLEELFEKVHLVAENCSLGHEVENMLTEQINLEIDDIKAKVLESECYLEGMEKESSRKKSKLILLNEYIKRMESNLKYIEDIKDDFENQRLRFKEIEAQYPEEINKLIDDNHRLNDYLNIKNTETYDLIGRIHLLEAQNYEFDETKRRLNLELVNLRIENEKLKSELREAKSHYDGVLKNINIDEVELENEEDSDKDNAEISIDEILSYNKNENHSENQSSAVGQKPPAKNTKKQEQQQEPTTSSSSTSNKRLKKSLSVKFSSNFGFSNLFTEQKKNFPSKKQSNTIKEIELIELENTVKNLEQGKTSLEYRIKSLQNTQDLLEQKIFLLENENERIKTKYYDEKELFDGNEEGGVNENIDTFNPLDGMSAFGGGNSDEQLIVTSAQGLKMRKMEKLSKGININRKLSGSKISRLLMAAPMTNRSNDSSKLVRKILSSPYYGLRQPKHIKSNSGVVYSPHISPLKIDMRDSELEREPGSFPERSKFLTPKRENKSKRESLMESNKAYIDLTVDKFSLMLTNIKEHENEDEEGIKDKVNTTHSPSDFKSENKMKNNKTNSEERRETYITFKDKTPPKVTNNYHSGDNNRNQYHTTSNINFINEGVIYIGHNFNQQDESKIVENFESFNNGNKHKKNISNSSHSAISFGTGMNNKFTKNNPIANVNRFNTYHLNSSKLEFANTQGPSVMYTFQDIGEALSSKPSNVATYDFINIEDDKTIKFLVEKNNDWFKENFVFSDNVHLYDQRFVKLRTYSYFIVTYEYIYVLDHNKERILRCNKVTDLYKISISKTNSNLIALHFYKEDDIFMESFRLVNLLYFFRDLFNHRGHGKLKLKSTDKFILKLNNKVQKYLPLSLGFNLTSCYKIGYAMKYNSGFFSKKFKECFLTLSDYGLMVYELPISEIPCRIVNVVGSDVIYVFDEYKYHRKYCLEITEYEGKTLVIALKNNLELYSWTQEIKRAKRSYYQKFNLTQFLDED